MYNVGNSFSLDLARLVRAAKRLFMCFFFRKYRRADTGKDHRYIIDDR